MPDLPERWLAVSTIQVTVPGLPSSTTYTYNIDEFDRCRASGNRSSAGMGYIPQALTLDTYRAWLQLQGFVQSFTPEQCHEEHWTWKRFIVDIDEMGGRLFIGATLLGITGEDTVAPIASFRDTEAVDFTRFIRKLTERG